MATAPSGQDGSSSLQDVGVQIRQHLPERLQGDWDSVLQRRDAMHARFGMELGEWPVEHGPSLGARPPTVSERSRSLGLESYSDRLNLAPVATYNAQGNSFDQAALGLRLAGLMQLLGSGQRIAGHGFAPPWRIAEIYTRVCAYCHAQGTAPEMSPYPADLRAAFSHTTDSSILATLGFEAAQGGRRER